MPNVNHMHNVIHIHHVHNGKSLYNSHNAINGGGPRNFMTDPEGWCILSIQKFPRELKKRLKMKALEREIDLQELCVKYLETGLAKDEPRTPTAANKK